MAATAGRGGSVSTGGRLFPHPTSHTRVTARTAATTGRANHHSPVLGDISMNMGTSRRRADCNAAGRGAAAPARLRHSAIALALMAALGSLGGMTIATPASAQQTSTAGQQEFAIPAGSLRDALNALGQQSDMAVVFSPELVEGKTTRGVSGRYTPAGALRQLLQGTGLEAQDAGNATFTLRRAAEGVRKSEPDAKTGGGSASEAREASTTQMPTIFVTAARSLNMDITRTEDDPQPYVVFDREQIERSGATSLEQFLQQRLTMNTSPANSGLGADGSGIATSQITLRGLSAAQTLILVDGHRVSSLAFSGSGQGALSQADITGLPLGAIERIEVLPTTASGIYGGSATGGVINIILRRDYTGGEMRFTYDNTFDTDTASRKMDVTFGHSFNQGKTSLMATASYSEANDLLLGDRDFVQRGRDAIWRNNPNYFLGPIGFPPLGATPNIASVDGSDLVLKDGTPLHAAFTSVPAGYIGPGSDDGVALVANASRYNWDLATTAQTGGSRQALYTQPRVKSGAIVVRHQVHEHLQVFTDLSSSQSMSRFPASSVSANYVIPASSPTNPFAQEILIAVPLSSDTTDYATTIDHQRALAGLAWELPQGWLLGADVTWDRTTVHNHFPDRVISTFGSAVAAGTVDVLRDTTAFPIDLAPYIGQESFTSPFRSTMTDFNLRTSGPIGTLPGGPLILSASAAHRDETVADALWFAPTANRLFYYPERSQTVTSAYLELRAPLFSARNARSGLRELDLQLAVRRDDYINWAGEERMFVGDIPSPLPEGIRRRSTFISTDPTVALRWKPWESLALRASYGTGFVPPGLNQQVPNLSPVPFTLGADPLRGHTRAGPYTLVSGGNAGLTPEQSESWSAGLVLTPTAWPAWRLSVDYTRIEKTDNIATHPGGLQGVINDEAKFPGRIVRGPNLPDDPPDWAGPITLVDVSLLNLASTTLDAWDVQFDVKKETKRFGTFDLFFVGTWQPHFKIRTIASQPEIEYAGISTSNPLKFKANAGVAWTRDAWRVGWNVRHFDAYRVSNIDEYINNQGHHGRVPSQTYHDVFIDYDFGLSGRTALPNWLTTVEAKFGIRNLLDKAPPFDAANSLGLYSRFGDPRLSSYYLIVTKRF